MQKFILIQNKYQKLCNSKKDLHYFLRLIMLLEYCLLTLSIDAGLKLPQILTYIIIMVK